MSSRLLKKKARRGSFGAKKMCRFCASPEQEHGLDYKNANLLRSFLTERGKILPSRISGNCAQHQRHMAHAIKKSRVIALIPYCSYGY